MSFGTPGKHGKFYAGRTDDTPVNHVSARGRGRILDAADSAAAIAYRWLWSDGARHTRVQLAH